MRRPILFSIPHGGQLVPEELKQSSALSPIDILEDSDPFTDRFYDLTSEGFIVVKATIARAFVDLNRADNDLPPQNPDGVIKSHTCYNVPVYLENQIPKGGFLTRILTKYYHSYHEKIHELCQNGNFLLGLDCHSMAASPPPIAPDQDQERPLICLGNAHGQSCPIDITESMAVSLSHGFAIPLSEISINQPFSGGFITRKYGNNPIPWIQVELNRNLYLRHLWYQKGHLEIEANRLVELRNKFLKSIDHFLSEKSNKKIKKRNIGG